MAGASIWSLQDHDFKGRCDKGIFALFKTINKRLQRKDVIDDNEDVTLDDLFPKQGWRCLRCLESSQSDSF